MEDINLVRADPNFRNELAKQPGGERISACLTCQTCTASCPITRFNDKFNPLRIIRLALCGFKEEVLASDFIWLCSSCYACQERCPRGISIPEFMTLLKNLAVKQGLVPTGVRAQMNAIKGEGRIYPIDEFDNKKRNRAGLPALPTSCEAAKALFPEEGDP